MSVAQKKLTTTELEQNMLSQEWRLNNLYYVKNEDGEKVKFKLRAVQKHFWDKMWYLSIILKARQLGMTTFIQLYMLDCCLFYSNKSAGVIAQNREAAEDFFNDKIKFAYENLPESIKRARAARSDSARELSFSNGSVIRVGTSFRSGVYQYLHISEFGKLCHERPDRAEEVISGSLNTVHVGNYVFIESTAEGAHGRFYEMVKDAEALTRHTKMDYKLFFFPWFDNPNYVLHEPVTITESDQEYFDQLKERKGIELTQPQKAWYVNKQKTLKSKMKQEMPSYPDEAFQRINEHAVYGAEFRKIREANRICSIDYDPSLPVHTFWDLGSSETDSTCIWFMQHKGQEYRFIDFIQGFKQKIQYFVKALQDKDYVYGTHYLPHDAGYEGKDAEHLESYERKLNKLGIKSTRVVPRIKHLNLGIEAVRERLAFCWFDEIRCQDGVVALQDYEYIFDEKSAMYTKVNHNWASHPSDAFRMFAEGYRKTHGEVETPLISERRKRRFKQQEGGRRVFV